MTKRAIVYDTDSGEILREMTGNVPVENQRLKPNEGILVDPDGETFEIPDSPSPVDTDSAMPADFTGKMVDTSVPEVVDDPNYSAPYTPSDWAKDRKAGNFSSDSEALDRLADALDN